MKSVFEIKEQIPDLNQLSNALGPTLSAWLELEKYTLNANLKTKGAWSFSGTKYGWSYRISDTKRAVVYLLPRDGFFKVAFVFSQKASVEIMESSVAESIKKELFNTKVYAEGRGIRIEVRDNEILSDIKQLILRKINH